MILLMVHSATGTKRKRKYLTIVRTIYCTTVSPRPISLLKWILDKPYNLKSKIDGIPFFGKKLTNLEMQVPLMHWPSWRNPVSSRIGKQVNIDLPQINF